MSVCCVYLLCLCDVSVCCVCVLCLCVVLMVSRECRHNRQTVNADTTAAVVSVCCFDGIACFFLIVGVCVCVVQMLVLCVCVCVCGCASVCGCVYFPARDDIYTRHNDYSADC